MIAAGESHDILAGGKEGYWVCHLIHSGVAGNRIELPGFNAVMVDKALHQLNEQEKQLKILYQ